MQIDIYLRVYESVVFISFLNLLCLLCTPILNRFYNDEIQHIEEDLKLNNIKLDNFNVVKI
jgi:hypothetical protein